MKAISCLMMILCLTTLAGCSQQVVQRSNNGGHEAQRTISESPVEVLRIGLAEGDVQARYGVPTSSSVTRTVQTTTKWTYEELGFSVSFLDGSLYTVAQWKGALSVGLKIGDSSSRLAELGIQPISSPVPTDLGVIGINDQSRIRIHGSNGAVERFILEPLPDDY